MSGDVNSEDRVNMVPLIDCMFFLILFFMIVTKFDPDEKAIASLLPTDKGQLAMTPSKAIAPVDQVNIVIYPEGMEKGHQPSEYRNQMQALLDADSAAFAKVAYFRVGGSNPIVIDGSALSQPKNDSPTMRDQIAQVHEYLKTELGARDVEGKPRKEQQPVVISCFSGMPWKYALLAYDAVRAYEATKTGVYNKTNFDLQEAREVSFAPPRIRNYSSNELGYELFEIVHMR